MRHVVVLLVATACGGYDDHAITQCAVVKSLGDVGNLGRAMAAMNGNDALRSVYKLNFLAGVVLSDDGAIEQSDVACEDRDPIETITATCAGTACDLVLGPSQCPTAKGAVIADGDRVSFKLFHTTGCGINHYPISVSVKGDFIANAATLEGNLQSDIACTEVGLGHGSRTIGQSTTTTDFLAFELDSLGCPTAGTVHARRTTSKDDDIVANCVDEIGAFEGTMTFGPTCGVVH